MFDVSSHHEAQVTRHLPLVIRRAGACRGVIALSLALGTPACEFACNLLAWLMNR